MWWIRTKEIGWFVGLVVSMVIDREADAMTFTLDNRSDVVVQRVLAGPDYDERWHEDLLGPTVLPPGDQRQFDVGGAANHCVFDIRVEWAHGLYREFRGRDLCEDSHVAFDGGRGLVVSNESRTEIAVAQANPDFEDSWGPDMLGEDEVIAPGGERVIMLEERYKSHCAFDIRLTTPAGASVEYRGRNLCDDSRIVFSDGNELTVANEGEETIYVIRVSVDHESQGWGRDLLAADQILPPGEEFATRLQQFSEDQCLFDVLVQVEDERRHVYEDVDICGTARLVHPRSVDPDAMRFTLDNQSDVVIQRVLATPDYDETWHEDLLGPTVLPPGDQRQFDVGGAANHCVFDIRVEWAHGLYREFRGRDLCEDSHVAFDGGRGLVVSNESRTEIAVAQANPDFEDSWGPDMLGEDEVIAPGGERVIMLEERYKSHCAFDIRLTTPAGASVEYRGRNLCDDSRIVFSDGNELTVANEGEETIYVIRVSVDHESQGWGRDLLAADQILPPGEEFATRLQQFSEDQCLFDVLVQVEEQRRHVYEDVDICKTPRLVHPTSADGGTPPAPIVPREDLAVGETFRDCEGWGCPWMVVVDGGAFERGSWERDDEAPVTNVTVPGPFAVGQFEVSVGQFEEFARDTGHDGGSECYVKRARGWRGQGEWRLTEGRSWRNPGFDQDQSHPVVCVSWDDAIAYTRWLAGRTDLPYRLLTEAEAELLATASAINFERSGRANCRNCGKRRRWDGGGTSPIGGMRPDDLGLTGVFGNAAEWVQDCYQRGYGNAPRDGSAWSPPSCERRVVRGGCWLTSAQKLRASGRDSGEPDRRSSCVGFRVARDLGERARL